MLRPSVDADGIQRRVPHRRLPRLITVGRSSRAVAIVAAAGMLTVGSVVTSPDAVGALGSTPAVIGADHLPVLTVDLSVAGNHQSQAAPASDVVGAGNEPVDVVSITVDDGGPVVLAPRQGSVDVHGISYPEGLTGVAASENGVQSPVGGADFEAAAERVFASTDLRDYIRSDGQSMQGSGWDADYDFSFSSGLTTDDYLLISERWGNVPVTLLALDGAGDPVAGAQPVEVGPPYGWNTGYAPSDESTQPIHLSVIDVGTFVPEGTTAHGFRVDNNDEADVKLLPLVATGEAPAEPGPEPEEPGTTSAVASAPLFSEHLGFTKTVYRGLDDGAGCAVAASYAEVNEGDPITYCFTVTNTGTDHLDSIVIADPAVAGTPELLWSESQPLAPGDSARYTLETVTPADEADGVIDETFTNRAAATATTVDAASNPVGAGTVTAEAEAVVFPPEQLPSPAVELTTTVYAGVDGGIGCPAADLTVVGEGDPVTYCFQVTNIGSTHLDSVEISDPTVPGVPTLLRADSMPLAPGASAYYYLDATAPALPPQGFTSRATSVANSVDATGADLAGLDDVTSSDGARITSAPTQLAFTGLESWLFAMVGAGLMAAGGALLLSPGQRLKPARVTTPAAGRPPTE